ncbi:Hypothetical protein, putative [Bodo saltans]|uniref:Uncharacterized protein n=1 Tax=Bodo saltans TaxID=75058 RepID=A0A0S4JMH4_BODSA|nr:Hypothetical protein, putative [Bodo saltans]|eukprot:CUG90478.1 Hypothetical protein, putative [Bodo saltans]
MNPTMSVLDEVVALVLRALCYNDGIMFCELEERTDATFENTLLVMGRCTCPLVLHVSAIVFNSASTAHHV